MSAIVKSRYIFRGVRKQATKHVSRCISTTSRRQGSPLFALGALSNARETQHFARESRLSRVEHSPNLQLIRSSEVIPFARKQPPAQLQPALERSQQPVAPNAAGKTAPPLVIAASKLQLDGLSEADLLSVGRAVLVEKNAQIMKLKQALEEEKDRSMKREATYALARTNSRDRIARLHHELSSEKLWKWTILATGLATAAWFYASETGNLSYSFGDVYPSKIEAKVADMVHHSSRKPEPVLTTTNPPPLLAAATPETPSPSAPNTPASSFASILNSLFWRS